MHIWRRGASRRWLERHEFRLRDLAGQQLAFIERPGAREVIVEVARRRRRDLQPLLTSFGGQIEKLSADWLQTYQRQTRQPIQIGRRLAITASSRTRIDRPKLIIPAGAAFGTGEHATTAMSLRFIEEITRKLAPGWSMLDLGTGSGIFALAARRWGAGKVTALDTDALALSTARRNGQANRIEGIDFRLLDARKLRSGASFKVVSANLHADLLIALLPIIARVVSSDGWAVISGILRVQEAEIITALGEAQLRAIQVRRRGKWIALLCRSATQKPI